MVCVALVRAKSVARTEPSYLRSGLPQWSPHRPFQRSPHSPPLPSPKRTLVVCRPLVFLFVWPKARGFWAPHSPPPPPAAGAAHAASEPPTSTPNKNLVARSLGRWPRVLRASPFNGPTRGKRSPRCGCSKGVGLFSLSPKTFL